MKVKHFDPSWLIELAKKQRPDLNWLPVAISQCKSYIQKSTAFYEIVGENQESPSSKAAKKFCIELSHPKMGLIVLQVLEGKFTGEIYFEEKHITSIEFVDKIHNV